MRRGNKPEILKDDDGMLIGINLGYDHVAEHEWGIEDLERAFGMPERRRGYNLFGDTVSEISGAVCRTITECPEALKFVPYSNGNAYLVYDRYWRYANRDLSVFASDLYLHRGDVMATGWSGQDFGVRIEGKDGEVILGAIYEAFKRKDAMIFLSGNHGNPFANSGLVLAIRSRMPEEVIDSMYEADHDALDIAQADADIETDTGLKAKLKEAGKRYYALSPSWRTEHRDEKGKMKRTKFRLIYWLNPQGQDENHFGWYTVEDLLRWAKGKGPVPMTEAEISERNSRYDRH